MKPEVHAIVTAVNELTRQMTVDAERIEKLEVALEVYSCSCSTADEDDCELGDWANISCGYRARKALEGKDD